MMLTAAIGTSRISAMNSISSRLARPFSGAEFRATTGPVGRMGKKPRLPDPGRALTSTVK
jgi:hypothetical protein